MVQARNDDDDDDNDDDEYERANTVYGVHSVRAVRRRSAHSHQFGHNVPQHQ